MTPICPHTLTNRSIIFRSTVRLRVLNRSTGAPLLVGLDGRGELRASRREPVDISIARQRLPLVQRSDYSHFSVMRTKLKWSGGVAERD
jgi:NAD+ kinase